MSLYTELRDAGVEINNHYSDLYFRATPESLAILNRYQLEKRNSTSFINQASPHKGECWIDVPFAYDPYWEAKEKAGKQ